MMMFLIIDNHLSYKVVVQLLQNFFFGNNKPHYHRYIIIHIVSMEKIFFCTFSFVLFHWLIVIFFLFCFASIKTKQKKIDKSKTNAASENRMDESIFISWFFLLFKKIWKFWIWILKFYRTSTTTTTTQIKT